MAHIAAPTHAPHLRLPVTALTVLGFVLFMLAGSVLLPAGDGDPAITWRGNAGNVESLR